MLEQRASTIAAIRSIRRRPWARRRSSAPASPTSSPRSRTRCCRRPRRTTSTWRSCAPRLPVVADRPAARRRPRDRRPCARDGGVRAALGRRGSRRGAGAGRGRRPVPGERPAVPRPAAGARRARGDPRRGRRRGHRAGRRGAAACTSTTRRSGCSASRRARRCSPRRPPSSRRPSRCRRGRRPFPLERLPGRRVLQGLEPETVTVRYRTRDSAQMRWSRVKARPMRTPDRGTLAINVIEDITDLKQAEEAQRLLAEAGRVLAGSLDVPRPCAGSPGSPCPSWRTGAWSTWSASAGWSGSRRRTPTRRARPSRRAHGTRDRPVRPGRTRPPSPARAGLSCIPRSTTA